MFPKKTTMTLSSKSRPLSTISTRTAIQPQTVCCPRWSSLRHQCNRTAAAKNITNYVTSYKDFEDRVSHELKIDMSDTANKRVQILWSDIEEVISKLKHKEETLFDRMEEFCEQECNRDALECRMFDV